MINSVRKAAKGVDEAIHETSGDLKQIVACATELMSTVNLAREGTAVLASATTEMSRTAESIRNQVIDATSLSDDAITAGATASSRVAELRDSTGEIGAVIDIINHIAKQTNLLALNATIEAARAGAAGKGFAIVASEVKALAVETQRATADIAQRIEDLRRDGAGSIEAVELMVAMIEKIRPVFTAIMSAVEDQTHSAKELASAADQSANFNVAVTESAEAISTAAAAGLETSTRAHEASKQADEAVSKLGSRFTIILRQSEIGDRRRFDRLPMDLPVVVRAQGRDVNGKTVDLSEDGMLLLLSDRDALKPGDQLDARVTGMGTMSGRVVAVSGLGTHCQFSNLTDEVRAAVLTRLADVRKANEKAIILAQKTASEIVGAVEEAIRAGRLRAEDVFDTDYELIPGTNPPQFKTKYLQVFEQIIPPIQDPVAANTHRLVFCAAVDRNAYLPVHNKAFSHPQNPNDPVWNIANCRNKRIFDDRAGLGAGRNTRPFLIQSYARDMGAGMVVMMKEIDAPIRICDRHWGGLRMAYKT